MALMVVNAMNIFTKESPIQMSFITTSTIKKYWQIFINFDDHEGNCQI